MASMQEDKALCIPEQYTRRKLNTLYRQIPLTDNSFRLLRKYFNAMANLYGIVPLWKAFEIIQRQNPGRFAEAELLAFAEIARHEEEDYHILGIEEIYPGREASPPLNREIIDVFQLGGVTGALDETRDLQRGKPYYVPPRKELLLYDDMTYIQQSPEYARFMDAIRSMTQLDEDKERIIFANLILKLRVMSVPVSDVLNELERLGIRFQGLAEVNQFTGIYRDFCNSARMQCNRGRTPNEIAAFCGDKGSGAITLSMLEKGIGRNSPCPCGSGRKYKKCCGR